MKNMHKAEKRIGDPLVPPLHLQSQKNIDPARDPNPLILASQSRQTPAVSSISYSTGFNFDQFIRWIMDDNLFANFCGLKKFRFLRCGYDVIAGMCHFKMRQSGPIHSFQKPN